MALLLPHALPKGSTPTLKFCLPHTDASIEVEAEVAWADVKGLAGVRFQQVPKEIQQRLECWLDARIEEEFPGTKDRISAAQARAADGSGFHPPPQREN